MKKGFTLVELLIVIAIIAIITAILFPVFATAREKARQSTCTSNQKQLALAVLQYVGDYDETYPSGIETQGIPGHYSGVGWGGIVFAYVHSPGIFECPDDPASVTVSGSAVSEPVSYAINCNLTGSTSYASQYFVNNASKLTMPTKTILFCEVENSSIYRTVLSISTEAGSLANSPAGNGNWLSNNANDQQVGGIHYVTGYLGGEGTTSYQSWQGGGSSVGASLGVHTNGANYILADGHVKWMLGSMVSPGYNNPAGGPSVAQGSWQAEGTQNGTHAATFSAI